MAIPLDAAGYGEDGEEEQAARRKPRTLKDYIDDAAKARSDLNIFYAVIAVLEGGTLSADSDRYAQTIIARCKVASQDCLERMDRAISGACTNQGASQ